MQAQYRITEIEQRGDADTYFASAGDLTGEPYEMAVHEIEGTDDDVSAFLQSEGYDWDGGSTAYYIDGSQRMSNGHEIAEYFCRVEVIS